MKRTNKNYKIIRGVHVLSLGKGMAITSMAVVSLAALPGCDLNESGGSQVVVDSTSSFVVIDGQTATPTPTGTVSSGSSTQSGSNTNVGNTNNNGYNSAKKATPTPKPTNNTTSTSATIPTPKPSDQESDNATDAPSSSSEQTTSGDDSSSDSESSSGSSSGGSSHTANPYNESCDCPYCSGDVSYRSARTVHHDAVTHDETDVYYDRVVRTFSYTINWTDSFRNWCAENGIDVPEAPTATGSVVFDSNWNTIDDSGEDDALDSIFGAAEDIIDNLGYNKYAFSYINEVISDEYEGRHENTTTVVDKEAWDENSPAGWYCDSCDYYSSCIPNEYEI